MYIQKYSPPKENINLNLIKAILGSINDELSLYNPENFKQILSLMTHQDIENFKKPSFLLKENKSLIYCNIIQYPLLNMVYYFNDLELTQSSYQEIKNSLQTDEFEQVLAKYTEISNHNEHYQKNLLKVKNLFQCWSDIEDVLNIDMTDYLSQKTFCYIEPYQMEECGFKRRDKSIFKEIDIFSAFSLMKKELPLDINITNQNISNCEHLLFIIANGTHSLSLRFNNHPGSYESLYKNILTELVELSTLNKDDLSKFNEALIKSSAFSYIMKNNTYPSKETVIEFKDQFDKLNPLYFTYQITRSEHKGFKVLESILEINHNPVITLDKYSKSLIKNGIVNNPEEALDKLLFVNKADKEYSVKLVEKNSKSNNNIHLSKAFFTTIKDWSDINNIEFDSNLKILRTIINSNKYDNLMNYVDCIDSEQLSKSMDFIQDCLNQRKTSFIINGKTVTSEHVWANISEYVLEKTIPVKKDISHNKPYKF